MSRSEKLLDLQEMRAKANQYQVELWFKKAIYRQTDGFLATLVGYLRLNPKALPDHRESLLSKDRETPEGIAGMLTETRWGLFESIKSLPEPLQEPAYTILNMLEMVPKIEQFSLCPLTGSEIAQYGKSDVRRFYETGSYFGWALGVRDQRYRYEDPTTSYERKVPVERDLRRPSEFLEDAIANLAEDIDILFRETMRK